MFSSSLVSNVLALNEYLLLGGLFSLPDRTRHIFTSPSVMYLICHSNHKTESYKPLKWWSVAFSHFLRLLVNLPLRKVQQKFVSIFSEADET